MKNIYIQDHMLSGTHIVRFNLKRNNIWWVTNNCPTRRPTWHGLKVNCLVEIWMKWCSYPKVQEGSLFNSSVFLVCHGCCVWLKGEAVSTLGTRPSGDWVTMQIFVKTLTGKTITLETCCRSPGQNSKCLVKVLLEISWNVCPTVFLSRFL